jgi:hypothetical protein
MRQRNVPDAPQCLDRPSERVGEARGIDEHVAVRTHHEPRRRAEAVLAAIAEVVHAHIGLDLSALGHAITMTARRRRRDLAIARSLGFVPRQSATSVVVMALTTALSGLIIALPFGVLVGTFVWRCVADGSALIGHVDHPWIAVAAVVPVGAVVALAVAALPVRRAGRDRILHNLRPE